MLKLEVSGVKEVPPRPRRLFRIVCAVLMGGASG